MSTYAAPVRDMKFVVKELVGARSKSGLGDDLSEFICAPARPGRSAARGWRNETAS